MVSAAFPLSLLQLFTFFLAIGLVLGAHNVTVDDKDPAIRYSPGWSWTVTPNNLNYGNFHAYSLDRAASALFSFTGTAVYIKSPRWPYPVSLQVQLDSLSPVRVDLQDYSREPTGGRPETVIAADTWGISGLEVKQHTLSVSFTSTTDSIAIDAFVYTVPDMEAPAPPLSPTPSGPEASTTAEATTTRNESRPSVSSNDRRSSSTPSSTPTAASSVPSELPSSSISPASQPAQGHEQGESSATDSRETRANNLPLILGLCLGIGDMTVLGLSVLFVRQRRIYAMLAKRETFDQLPSPFQTPRSPVLPSIIPIHEEGRSSQLLSSPRASPAPLRSPSAVSGSSMNKGAPIVAPEPSQSSHAQNPSPFEPTFEDLPPVYSAR